MKVFITGATGFIGTHLAQRLAQTSHQMYCLVRPTSNTEKLKKLRATLVPGDVTDRDSVLKGMKGCDWVMNVAAIYSFWERDKRVYRRVNAEGTRNVMESALQTGVSKVVHVSSCVIYGEPSDRPFTEESPVGPARFSEYARTKYEGDLIIWDLYRTRRLPVVMIYPGGVLGPGDPKFSGQYIRNLIDRKLPATSLGSTFGTYVHVRDVAEAIVRAAEKADNIGQRYLVGKEQLSGAEYNRMISDISGVPLPSRRLPDSVVTLMATVLTWWADLTKKPPLWDLPADSIRTGRHDVRFDGSKAERELGLVYTPIRVALEETIASLRQ